MSPVAAPFRVLRGVAVAGAGLGLASAGHLVGGGSTAVAPWMVLVVLLVGTACVLASDAGWTLRRLVGVLAGISLATHLLLWLTSAAPGIDPRLAAVSAVPADHAHSSAAHAGVTPAMLAAHLLAIVVAAALLAGLDRALIVLVTFSRTVARLVSGTPLLLDVDTARRAPAAAPVVVGSVPRSTLRHRGPPVRLALR